MGGRLTNTVPCVSIGSHFGPPPPPHAYKRPSWILSSASLSAVSKEYPILMDKVGEALSLAQSCPYIWLMSCFFNQHCSLCVLWITLWSPPLLRMHINDRRGSCQTRHCWMWRRGSPSLWTESGLRLEKMINQDKSACSHTTINSTIIHKDELSRWLGQIRRSCPNIGKGSKALSTALSIGSS